MQSPLPGGRQGHGTIDFAQKQRVRWKDTANHSKPEIVFESFALSTSVAACKEETDLPSKGICGFQHGPDVVFVSKDTGCDFWDESPEDFNGICYHNPSEDTRLFGS